MVGLDGSSRWHEFLDVVLPLVAVGGRITGYLARDIDLARRGCRVTVTQVRVQPPEYCAYFPHKTALVPVITVVAESAGSDAGTAGQERDRGRKRHKSALPVQPLSASVDAAASASSSRRRRFADIRACLQEQNLLLDAPIECVESLDAPVDVASRRLLHLNGPDNSRDDRTRTQFLATLRQKHQQQQKASAKQRDRT